MTDVVPIRLNRRDASKYLLEQHGLKVSYASLAKLATLGGGPKFRKPNQTVVLYDRSSLDEWAVEKLGEEYGSTAEIGAA